MRVPWKSSSGFALIELMVAVLLVGILVSIVVPMYTRSAENAAEKACFQNQRSLETAVQAWLAGDPDGDREKPDLAGVVDSSHPLVADGLIATPPTCPSAPEPTDRTAPTLAEGAYELNPAGTVAACPFGGGGAHGHF
jgi:prepilin-type N-terminal cleavage/methylation domain-containing protein